jgi:hypothetical protein
VSPGVLHHRPAHPLLPVVGLCDDLEERGSGGVADAHRSHLDPEEAGVLARTLVDPVKCLSMLFVEGTRHPDDGAGISSARIREELSQVRVIARLELVLDDQHAPVREVTTVQVEGIATDRMLRPLQLHPDAERLFQNVGIPKEPRGEVAGLVRPNGPQVDVLES